MDVSDNISVSIMSDTNWHIYHSESMTETIYYSSPIFDTFGVSFKLSNIDIDHLQGG